MPNPSSGGRIVLCGLFLAGAVAFAQPAFEVASVKANNLSKAGGEGRFREDITANPGTLTMRNVSLKSAVQWAYNVREYQVKGPSWLGDERFDISAKAGATVGEPQLRQMLQTLLATRFNMKVHQETKEISVYALVPGKGGIKMKPGNPEGKSNFQAGGLNVTATDTTLGELADMLSSIGFRIMPDLPPVIDPSGSKTRYNFTVDGANFLQELRTSAGAGQQPGTETILAGVRDILDAQLGLNAELRKVSGALIVVDRAEKVPAEN